MAKQILIGNEARESVFKGAQKVCLAVASTLGPCGRTALIQQNGTVVTTKDGVTVAKSIELADHAENVGADLIKNIASQTDDSSGDGTTTSTIMTMALLEQARQATSMGSNPIYVKNGMIKALDDVEAELDAMAIPVETEEQIEQVATISANNDNTIGKLVRQAVAEVGNDGVITLADSKTTETTVEFTEGMKFPNGFLSPYFATDPETLTANFEDAFILLTTKKLTVLNDIVPLLEQIRSAGRPLLIVAPEVEGELMTSLIVNNLRKVVSVCAVKSPGYGDKQKDMMEDLAVLTGGKVIDEEIGMKLETTTLQDLGVARTVTVTKDDTTIVGGNGAKEAVEARVEFIKKQLDEATSDYEKEKFQERIARLAGGVCVINVGAISEQVCKEKRYRIEDAVNSARQAVTKGIIPGGGTALAQISKKLEDKDLTDLSADEKVGYNIILKAITKPLRQIAENAGYNGDVVLNIVQNSEPGVGFNALTGKYEDMVKAGIIDAVKVTQTALENSASVSALISTSGCVVVDLPEEDKKFAPDVIMAPAPMI